LICVNDGSQQRQILKPTYPGIQLQLHQQTPTAMTSKRSRVKFLETSPPAIIISEAQLPDDSGNQGKFFNFNC
jgi:hypothetical protein